MKKLTPQQYNTLKAIHANNPQGVTLDEFVQAACALKELEYDPSIHDGVETKVPLKEHISSSEAGLGESSKSTHKHEYKRTETPIQADNPRYTGKPRKFVYDTCKCGHKIILDYI